MGGHEREMNPDHQNHPQERQHYGPNPLASIDEPLCKRLAAMARNYQRLHYLCRQSDAWPGSEGSCVLSLRPPERRVIQREIVGWGPWR